VNWKAVRVFLRICEAVSFAHANGIIHCDLKPENVMLGDFGEVLVMDWGVARETGATGSLIAGTRGFMAPEQERGDVASIDTSTDVYALGAILRAILPDAPKPLAAVIAKATSPDRAERYADAKEVADEITRYLDDAPLRAYRATALERAAKWLARNSALVTVVVAYLIMRVIVFLWIRR